jgi:hypothetical protein
MLFGGAINEQPVCKQPPTRLSSCKDPVDWQYRKLIIVDNLLFDLHGIFAT